MQPVQVNFMAVILSAVASMVIGFVWYGPILGKEWMKAMGYTAKTLEAAKKGMEKTYALSALGALVMAYVLAHAASYAGATTAQQGAMVGFWNWLGFVAPVQMTDVLFGSKSWKLYAINTGYQLASLLAMGVILVTWK